MGPCMRVLRWHLEMVARQNNEIYNTCKMQFFFYTASVVKRPAEFSPTAILTDKWRMANAFASYYGCVDSRKGKHALT